jgi:hypothetical protein
MLWRALPLATRSHKTARQFLEFKLALTFRTLGEMRIERLLFIMFKRTINCSSDLLLILPTLHVPT